MNCVYEFNVLHRDHSFSTYAKYSEKLAFLTPLQGARNASFSENFAYVLNESSHVIVKMIKHSRNLRNEYHNESFVGMTLYYKLYILSRFQEKFPNWHRLTNSGSLQQKTQNYVLNLSRFHILFCCFRRWLSLIKLRLDYHFKQIKCLLFYQTLHSFFIRASKIGF